MSTHPRPSDLAFTPAVKMIQDRRGSREAYARMEEGRGWPQALPPDLQGFIEAQDSIFLATASAAGQPYVQHRGGPPGFLHVLDEHTIAFADFEGNRQYISTGNLSENPRAYLFMMDYVHRQRFKFWGRARVVEDDPALLARLVPEGYAARAAAVIVFTVEAWSSNCPKHIPQLLPAAEVVRAIEERDGRIADLERELGGLKARLQAAETHLAQET